MAILTPKGEPILNMGVQCKDETPSRELKSLEIA